MKNLLRPFVLYLSVVILFLSPYCHAYESESGPSTSNTASHVNANAYRNYTKLRELLAAYQMAQTHPWPTVTTQRPLKIGKRNHAVLVLRERLRASSDLASSNDFGGDLFDESLEQAVQIFQARHGLNADGVVGKSTLYQLNISPQERARQIQVNIQRWQELATVLGNRYVLVNIPNYHLDLVDNGMTLLSMKVIVGKPTLQTPTLDSTISRVVFNPYWNVPRSIANKDIIPKLLDDPDYLEKHNIKILSSQEDDAYRMHPSEIDWNSAAENGFQYHFRQEPGEENSLGVIKFEFDNPFHVYLHDTPTKELFSKDERDLSHGCVRIEDPVGLANYLLKDNSSFDNNKMQEILATQKPKYIRVNNPIPIYIAYITAWVDENGVLQFRDDIYGKDSPIETTALTPPTDVAEKTTEDPY